MSRSKELFLQARDRMPGGVNSPVRAFGSVGGNPIFFQYANGAYLTDVDDKRYIDYVCGWGPMILGHGHPQIIETIQTYTAEGICFGTPHPLEVALAQKITDLMPSMEMLRMVSSGTEATLSVLRLARGYTKRNKIIKFAGCYHGHHDALLVKSGSGCLTFGSPTSAGIPPKVIEDTLVADFNDTEHVAELFSAHGDDIAAVIVEPVAGNMGCIPPKPEFLKSLRELCDKYSSLLIFDEVISGFRVAKGGAQALYKIKPDLTTLGKIIGGGLPVAAFGGKKAIMEHLSPLGEVYQAGTLSGNPLGMAAGLATLTILGERSCYDKLFGSTQLLVEGIKTCAQEAGIPLIVNQVGALFSLFFTEQSSVDKLSDVHACDFERFTQHFHHMLSQAMYIAPSGYECYFMSTAHQAEEIELTLRAFKHSFSQLK